MEKKGAMEMSMGTIVILVLAMTMLILGLVLIKNILSGADDNVSQINDKVKDQIGKLFVENKKTVIYLPNRIAKIRQNEEWGIAFGIVNLKKGSAQAGEFGYSISVSDPTVQNKCGISEEDVGGWIVTGGLDTLTLAPGEIYYGIVRFLVPENAPLCTVRFHLDVTLDGAKYATDFFDIEVLA